MKGMTNLLELLRIAAQRSPHQQAFQFLSEKDCQAISYLELDQKARALAALLQQHDCCGERAMLLLPPSLDYIVALFGCLYAGIVPVPAYPPKRNHHGQRLEAILLNAQAKFILTHEIFAPHCPEANFILELDTLNFDSQCADQYKHHSAQENDLAFLQYTSGSTHTPKGVMVNQKNIINNLELIVNYFGKDCQRACSWLPLYHDLGLIGGVFMPVYLQIPATLMSPTYFLQSPFRWLEVLSKEKSSITAAPNFAYDLCVDKVLPLELETLDLSHLHYALNGAEPIRHETLRRFYEKFSSVGFSANAVRPVYGLAEVTLMASVTTEQNWQEPLLVSKKNLAEKKINDLPDEFSPKIALVSSGQCVRDHEICIVNPENQQLLSEKEIGEIWIFGPSVAQGYWNQDDLTQSIFRAQLSEKPNKFYLRTGDLGFLVNGELYVTGRLKDLLIIHGVNHYPHDIELTIMQSHPALQTHATAVFSVEEDNHEKLIIMQEIARSHLSSFNAEEVVKIIRSVVLAEHGLVVHSILLLKPYALSKTSSGKIQRWACKEAYLSQNTSTVYQWRAEKALIAEELLPNAKIDLQQWLTQWMATRFKVNIGQITLETSLAEFGLDSIAAAELAADMQRDLQKNIDPVMLLESSTLGNLIQGLLNPNKVKAIEKVTTIQYGKIEKNSELIKSSKHPLEDLAKKIYFLTTENVSKNTIAINEKLYINYAGYNYLGLSGESAITEAAIAAIKEYGTSVSASRIASGQKPLHAQLEKSIARLIGAEDCVVYSSGHATNISVITHLFGVKDLIVHDALCHNSILQGAVFSGADRIAFPHNDYQALRNILMLNRESYNRVLIVSEGVFSMDGDIPDVPMLIKIKNEFDAFLMLDEAHSIGTIGATGTGIREYFNLDPKEVDIWMGTLSKAFASCGGYIAGSAELIDHLKYNAAGFVYSAGISPANTAASYAAIQLMQSEPWRVLQLQQRQNLLLTLLQNQGINTGNSKDTPVIPVITGDEQGAVELSLVLQQQGIYAIPIMFPAVEKGLARVRLFVNCLHTEEQIRYTVNVIQKSYTQIPV